MRNPYPFYLFLLLALILQPMVVFSQLRKVGAPKGGFQKVADQTGREWYLLEARQLNYENGICGYLNNLMKTFADPDGSGRVNFIYDDWVIQYNHFIESSKTISNTLQECPQVDNDIDNQHFGAFRNNVFERPLVISGLSGDLQINGNRIPYLFFSGATHGKINVSNDTIISNVHLMRCNYDKFELIGNVFKKDSARVDVMNSTINNLFITANRAKVMNIHFTQDTVGLFDISNHWLSEPKSSCGISEISFFQSQLNDYIMTDVVTTKYKCNLRFRECSFGKKAWLLDVDVDTLEMTNCNEIASGMMFNSVKRSHPTILKFNQTDLKNVGFDYDERYLLYQWSNPEATRSVYEALLVKFQNEKKMDSFERVDKEYFQFRHNWLVNFISFCWWDYGYNKWLIIYWTIAFVLLFTAINFLNWNNCLLAYPIKKAGDISTTPSSWQKVLKILVYTSFIFFSIKVDFEKLSFKKTGWLVYFFIQYIIGLICLFFIANAILKL